MARLLTQKDVYSIVNAMVEDLTGQQSTIRAVDTSTFVSVGEQILAQGTENVLNELGLLVGRILVAARPYKGGRFNLINAIDTGIAILVARHSLREHSTRISIRISRIHSPTAGTRMLMVILRALAPCGSSICMSL